MNTTRRRPEAEGSRTGVSKHIRDYVALEKRRRDLETELKSVKALLDTKKEGVMDHFQQMGYDKITLDGITLYINRAIRASKNGEADDTTFKAAMESAGLGHLVKSTVNANSLASHFRNYEESLEAPVNRVEDLVPENLRGFINIHEIFDIRSRKG